MSTKRPSIVVNSDIIQKYVGSDFDAIAFLDSRISTLESTIESLGDLPEFVEQTEQIGDFINQDLYVEKPLLDNEVDYSGDGYDESTLGALLTAFAIDLQLTQKVDRGTLVVADNATKTVSPFDYNTPGVAANLPNDGLDVALPLPRTDISQAPTGITTFYNTSTNSFDFSQFNIGDLVTLRIDLDVATSTVDQEVDFSATLAEGTVNARTLKISREYFRVAGAYNITGEVSFYIADDDIRTEEGHVQIFSAADASVVVNSFEAFVTTKN